MDRDKDAKLTFEEFAEGSKQDPTIVQVGLCSHDTRVVLIRISQRPCPCTMDWYDNPVGVISYINILRTRMSDLLGYYQSSPPCVAYLTRYNLWYPYLIHLTPIYSSHGVRV